MATNDKGKTISTFITFPDTITHLVHHPACGVLLSSLPILQMQSLGFQDYMDCGYWLPFVLSTILIRPAPSLAQNLELPCNTTFLPSHMDMNHSRYISSTHLSLSSQSIVSPKSCRLMDSISPASFSSVPFTFMSCARRSLTSCGDIVMFVIPRVVCLCSSRAEACREHPLYGFFLFILCVADTPLLYIFKLNLPGEAIIERDVTPFLTFIPRYEIAFDREFDLLCYKCFPAVRAQSN